LVAQGWRALYHDVEILGVQVDLLMKNPAGVLTLIEVKGNGYGRLAHISYRQMQRLIRTVEFLAQFEAVEMRLALVEGIKIAVLPVDALTAR
jgi:Holliday junction resolvase-like predicted endonuclease